MTLPLSETSHKITRRYATSALLILIGVCTVWLLTQRLIGQLYSLQAQNKLRIGDTNRAVELSAASLRYCPRSASVQKVMAQGYQKASEVAPGAGTAWRFARLSKNHFQIAASLSPLDAEIQYSLALVEARLKLLFPILYPQRKYNPFNALPYFHEAIRLFPNAVPYRLALARYLFQYQDMAALKSVLQTISSILPESYDALIRERFWSPDIRIAVKNGLLQAINDQIDPRTAHQKLADLLAVEEDWAGALRHGIQAVQLPTDKPLPEDYFQLGRLYLKNGLPREAEFCFFNGLDISRNRDQQVITLCRLYQQEGAEALLTFFNQAKSRYPLKPQTEVTTISFLIALQQFNQARTLLLAMNRQEPRADAFYWLSKIAEYQKDWDAMEIAIQKATVLDPVNLEYRQVFYRLLKQLGKLATAEQELDRIIAISTPPVPRFYEERAQMRFNRKDYSGAILDWEESLKLSPNRAHLHAQIAEAHIKNGNLTQALSNYRKAAILDPKNDGYRQKVKGLDADG